MNNYKFVFIIILLIALLPFAMAEKRIPRVSMNDLTNPHSPSYVPYPYPQTNDEVIADLKYSIKKDMETNQNQVLLDNDPAYVDILPNLLKKSTRYKIYSIQKGKTLSSKSLKGYFWLIIISNPDNTENMRVALEDTGLFALECIFPQGKNQQKIITGQDVLSRLSTILKKTITMKDVQKIELVSYPPKMGNKVFPAWEITLKQDKTYYYDQKKDKVFIIKKIYEWKKNSETGKRTDLSKYLKRSDVYSRDEVNDRVMIFQEITQ